MVDGSADDRSASSVVRTFRGASLSLRDVTAWVMAFANSLALPRQVTRDVDLCLNEVLANVLRHGGGSASDCEIAIRLDQLPDGVRLTISDDTPPFDPLPRKVPPPPESIMEATEGGYGIQLVRTLATRASYRRDNGRNILSLDFQASEALSR